MRITLGNFGLNRRIVLNGGRVCRMMTPKRLDEILTSSVGMIRTASHQAPPGGRAGSADPRWIYLLYICPLPSYIREPGGATRAVHSAEESIKPYGDVLKKHGLQSALDTSDAAPGFPAGFYLLVKPA